MGDHIHRPAGLRLGYISLWGLQCTHHTGYHTIVVMTKGASVHTFFDCLGPQQDSVKEDCVTVSGEYCVCIQMLCVHTKALVAAMPPQKGPWVSVVSSVILGHILIA
jgi:hypothetical protein